LAKKPIVGNGIGETCKTSAVSSALKPPKKRSSTTWVLRQSNFSRARSASSIATMSASSFAGHHHLPAGLLKGVERVRVRLMAIVGPGLPPRIGTSGPPYFRRTICGYVWKTRLMQGSYPSALVSPVAAGEPSGARSPPGFRPLADLAFVRRPVVKSGGVEVSPVWPH
jgi:hypothetical protein